MFSGRCAKNLFNLSKIIFLSILLCCPKESLSQNTLLGQSVEATEARAIITQRIAEVAFPGPDRVSPVLAQFGYTPSVPSEVWRNFPAVHKFDTAYRDAEAARPGSGPQFLSEVIKKLAIDYDFIRNDAELKAFADAYPSTSAIFRFSQSTNNSLIVVDAKNRGIILRLADHLERGVLGSAERVLSVHFGLTEEKSYEILRTSKSYNEVLFKAYAELDRKVADKRILRLYVYAGRLMPEVNNDMRLKRAAIALFIATNPRLSSCPSGTVPCGCTNGRDLGCVPEGSCVGPC